jgi:hypothetical protein
MKGELIMPKWKERFEPKFFNYEQSANDKEVERGLCKSWEDKIGCLTGSVEVRQVPDLTSAYSNLYKELYITSTSTSTISSKYWTGGKWEDVPETVVDSNTCDKCSMSRYQEDEIIGIFKLNQLYCDRLPVEHRVLEFGTCKYFKSKEKEEC